MIFSSIPKIGDMSEDVYLLQRILASKKYYEGACDEIFGAYTQRAIAKFQLENSIPSTGVLGPQTLKALGIDVVASYRSGGFALTKDLPGRQARHLHPTLRRLLEYKLAPETAFPECFIKKNVPQMVVSVAMALASFGIKESGGNNHGLEVGFIQSIIGPYAAGGNGDSWCMSTDQCIVAFIEDYLQVESPFPASEGCTEVMNAALAIPGLVSDTPEVGTAFIAQHGDSWKGHTGFVLDVFADKMTTFEGNTNADGSRDGDGAAIKTRNQKQNGELKTLGFVRLYPKV